MDPLTMLPPTLLATAEQRTQVEALLGIAERRRVQREFLDRADDSPQAIEPVQRPAPSHLPEYLIEAVCLGAFMVSAMAFAALLFHPASPAAAAIASLPLRRALMGVAMGLTAVALIYSPFGMRSGAHMNPATTLAFLRLGRVAPRDAGFYALFQGLGAVAGAAMGSLVLGAVASHPAVNHVATVPGRWGAAAAFAGETAISFVLMLAVLFASNAPRLHRFTGIIAGALLAVFITFESPLSGTSVNPARSLGSALLAGRFDALWIYLTAPPLGMLLAAETFRRVRGAAAARCAKLHHENRQRCIFRCGFGDGKGA